MGANDKLAATFHGADMAWTNGGEGSKIPDPIKRQVRARQHNQCNTYNPTLCTGRIDEYDHITNIKTLHTPRHLANDPNNIQGLCTPCHKTKTQTEATAGKRRHLRPRQPHPSDRS
jgi:5-methylcytosine-specific restriction endonuclease McrA